MKRWIDNYCKKIFWLGMRIALWFYLFVVVAWLAQSWDTGKITVFFEGNTGLCGVGALIVGTGHTLYQQKGTRTLFSPDYVDLEDES